MATKNFTNEELSCSCCGLLPSQGFQDSLQNLRDDYGKPIYPARVATCVKRNKKIGGAAQSQHVPGEWNNFDPCAIDVKQKTFHNSSDRARFLAACVKNGFTCFGIGERKFHADSRPDFINHNRIVLLWGY